jgi:hypothetical protein
MTSKYCQADESHMLVKLVSCVQFIVSFMNVVSCKVTSSVFRTKACICDLFYIFWLW